MRKIQFQKGDSKSIVLIVGAGLTGLISVLMVIGFLAFQRTKEIEDIQNVQQAIGGTSLSNSTLQDTIRDTKRTTDLRAIKSALEMYRSENEKYPSKLSEILRYLSPLPLDPTTNEQYEYSLENNGVRYMLKATLTNGEFLIIRSP